MKEDEDKYIGIKMTLLLIAMVIIFLMGLVNTCSKPNVKGYNIRNSE